MGMDVCGKGNKQAYFRNNVWWWRPLADYCGRVAPELWGKIKYSQSNDGDGLNTKDSLALAAKLRSEIASGRTKEYEDGYTRNINTAPDEKCDLCAGTGMRNDAIFQGKCNKCNGKGKVRPWDSAYPFSTDNVEKFCTFLEECQGFEIW